MDNNYKIEMGNFREDHSIFYSEYKDGKLTRELTVAVDFVKNVFYYLPIFNSSIILHVDSFKNWNATRTELTLYEYTVVLKRIYDFLQRSGYRIVLG
ncbi:MAG: hypothetical protein KF856_13490 [Cyclobacteriaceae bacterium]|nr:hypothetical protein [Cyclobacteriaceae bacterium]